MLIVEGSDGVGKTTFCHKLLEKLQKEGPWIYSHLSKPPPSWQHPASYYPRMSTFIVQDRFHMSDLAYRHARLDPQALSPFAYSLVDAKLRQLGGMTVVLRADDETIKANYRGDGDMHDVKIHYAADRAFIRLMERTGPFVDYSIDWDFCWPTMYSKGVYPDDDFVDTVVRAYLRRVRELHVYARVTAQPWKLYS